MGVFKEEDLFYTATGDLLTKFLRNGQDENMSLDGSVTPVQFLYEVPENADFLLALIVFHLYDDSEVSANIFGGISVPPNGVLDNGLKLEIFDQSGNPVIDLLDGTTIRTNGDWTAFADNLTIVGNGFAAIVNVPHGRFLRIKPGHKIVMTVQDDLTSILQIRTLIKGLLVPTTTPL